MVAPGFDSRAATNQKHTRMTKVIDNRKPFWHSEEIPPESERPVCAGCGKPRQISKEAEMTGSSNPKDWSHQTGRWRYTGYGYFCTLRCATDYANRMVKTNA